MTRGRNRALPDVVLRGGAREPSQGPRVRMTVVARTAGSLLVALALVAGAAGMARAGTLDPFRHHSGQHQSLDPFKVAQAVPPATPSTGTPSPAPSCRSDDDCSGERYCDAGSCKPIGTRTNIAYLYYREGSFREIPAPLLVEARPRRVHRAGPVLLALLEPRHRVAGDRAVLLALRGLRARDRHHGDPSWPTGVLEPRSRDGTFVRHLAAFLRLQPFRLGAPAVRDLRHLRPRRRDLDGRGGLPLLVAPHAGPILRPRVSALHFVAHRGARLHLRPAPQLLLAERRRLAHPGHSVFLREPPQNGLVLLHLGRLPPPRGDGAQRVAPLALLVRRQSARGLPLRRALPAALELRRQAERGHGLRPAAVAFPKPGVDHHRLRAVSPRSPGRHQLERAGPALVAVPQPEDRRRPAARASPSTIGAEAGKANERP